MWGWPAGSNETKAQFGLNWGLAGLSLAKSLAIKVLIDDNGHPEEIKRTESELEAIIEEVVNQERDKMSTWRLLNDEKPTRAMISLENKICDYTKNK